MKTDKIKCYFIGCNDNAVNEVTKLFSDRGTFHTCKEHTPNKDKRPEAAKKLPFFYSVKPLK